MELTYRGPRWFLISVKTIGVMATVLALIFLYLELTGRIAEKYRRPYLIADTILCAVFAGEFVVMLLLCSARRVYARRHWADLLASVPMIHELRAFRALRVLRLLRAFRAGGLVLRAIRQFEDVFALPLMRNALAIGLAAVVIGGLAIADIERDNDRLNSIDKAVWWSFTTMITAEYSELPMTGLARLIGAVLIILGVGVFGVLAGSVASVLLRSSAGRDTVEQVADGPQSQPPQI